MRQCIANLLAALFVIPVFTQFSPAAEPSGRNSPPPASAALPKSLIFELRRRDWGSFPPSGRQGIEEVEAKPGDEIGRSMFNGRPFTVVEITSKASARIRVSDGFLWKGTSQAAGGVVVLKMGDKLEVRTRSCDAGTDFMLRITDLDRVPVVTADNPELIVAISAHAAVNKDDVGSVQEVLPWWADDPPKGFTDNDMRIIGKLKNLRRLTVRGNSITKAGYSCLKSMDRLVCLDLSQSSVDDDALSNLAGLKRLEELNLFRTKIGDSGLRYLKSLPRLEKLDLGDTNVSDEAVKVLREMKGLKSVGVSGTRFTPVGLKELDDMLTLRSLQKELDDMLKASLPKLDGPLSGLSGQLGRPQTKVRSEHYFGPLGEQERFVSRLVLLGCSLRRNKEGKIVEASVPVNSFSGRNFPNHPIEQTREAFDLLRKLDTVEILRMRCDGMDESVTAMFAKLRRLRVLDLQFCKLTDAAWTNVGQLSQLRKLHLSHAQISGEWVRKLHKLMPNCKIDGRASTDTKTPPTNEPLESVMQRLRQVLPGKNEGELLRFLRSQVCADIPVEGQGTGWIARRLGEARKQWEAIREIEGAEGRAYYDYEFGEDHNLIEGAQSSVPEWLRELLGDDFFHAVLSVHASAANWWEEDPPPQPWMKLLPNLPQLRWLSVHAVKNLDRELEHLKELRQLRVLNLENCQLTGDGFRQLRDLPKLSSLRLFDCANLTDAGVQHIGGLTRLRKLELYATHYPYGSLRFVEGLLRLEELNLSSSGIAAADLDHLRPLRSLKKLDLSNNRIEPPDQYPKGRDVGRQDQDLGRLKEMTQLEELNLLGNDLSDAGLAHIETLTRLNTLSVSSAAITDAGIWHLRGLTHLRKLQIGRTSIDDAGLERLNDFHALEDLCIADARITGEGLKALTKFGKLRHLEIDGNQANDAGLGHLKQLPQLRELVIYGAADRDFGDLQRALPKCKIENFHIQAIESGDD